MSTQDMYAIAAQVQRSPGFGFTNEGGPIRQAELEYASIVSRILANLVDGIITAIGGVIILIALMLLDRSTGGGADGSKGVGTLLILLAAIVAFSWLYNVAQETSSAQATLGKRLLGLKVATPTGGRIGVPQATIRLLVKGLMGIHAMVGAVIFVLNIVCLVANSGKNRTLHDLVAGTVVIKG
jgi:uncharacterized RDD family membrane protein YckC